MRFLSTLDSRLRGNDAREAISLPCWTWIPACAGMTIKSKQSVIPAQAGIQFVKLRV